MPSLGGKVNLAHYRMLPGQALPRRSDRVAVKADKGGWLIVNKKTGRYTSGPTHGINEGEFLKLEKRP